MIVEFLNSTSLRLLFNSNHSYDYADIQSPIEEILINHLIKFLHSDTKLILQYPISTISGNFAADVVMIRNERIVIIECDGAEYHNTTSSEERYDDWRDTLILIEKKANTIYRVKGIDIKHNLYKVFFIIYKYDKLFFNDWYASRIPEFNIVEKGGRKFIHYDYYLDDDHIKPSVVEVYRKNLNDDFNRDWFKFVLYSLLYKDKKIRGLIQMMASKKFDIQQLIKMLNEKSPHLNIDDENQLIDLFK